jgi:hypothetical protein
MSDVKNVRKIWLTLRLNDEEQKRLKDLYKVTACKALSEYARDILLQQPVVINYRNQYQAVKKLHTLDHLPELQTWILLKESSKQLLFKKIDEIKNFILQMHEQWLQK